MEKQKQQHETIRIWSRSVKKLRMIYALTGETMVRILDRLLTEELQQVQDNETHAQNPQTSELTTEQGR